MKGECCLLLVAVLATTAFAEPPAWRYYQNSGRARPPSDTQPWRPIPPEKPPAYQSYSASNTGSQYTIQSAPAVEGPYDVGSYSTSNIGSEYSAQSQPPVPGPQQSSYSNSNTRSEYTVQSVPALQGPDDVISVNEQPSFLPPQQSSSQQQQRPSQYEQEQSSLRLSSTPSLGGAQSFYFSPKERALYQVMKIMLSPEQFNMIQGTMQNRPDVRLHQGGGYYEPAPAYGPPKTTTTTTTTEAPIEQSASVAIPPPRVSVPARLVYRNRPKYNFTFTVRTWNGEECEFDSEPEPNEGQNPRLRPLPIRSKRGIMRCTPTHSKAKGGHGFRAKDRAVVADENRNPLQPFRAPSATPPVGNNERAQLSNDALPTDLRPLNRERTEVTEDDLGSLIRAANDNQVSQNNPSNGNLAGQRDLREVESRGRIASSLSNLGGNPAQDSYLPPNTPASDYGPPKSQYGEPKGYGPPKPEYGPPEEEQLQLEADEAGGGNANRETGTTNGGYEITQKGAGEI